MAGRGGAACEGSGVGGLREGGGERAAPWRSPWTVQLCTLWSHHVHSSVRSSWCLVHSPSPYWSL